MKASRNVCLSAFVTIATPTLIGSCIKIATSIPEIIKIAEQLKNSATDYSKLMDEVNVIVAKNNTKKSNEQEGVKM